MRVNSLRKKVIKDLNYQVKEYMHLNLKFLIDRIDKFYETMDKPVVALTKKQDQKISNSFVGIKGKENEKQKIQLKHYQALINDLKVLYGLNVKFMQPYYDISLGPRIMLTKRIYDNSYQTFAKYHKQ